MALGGWNRDEDCLKKKESQKKYLQLIRCSQKTVSSVESAAARALNTEQTSQDKGGFGE